MTRLVILATLLSVCCGYVKGQSNTGIARVWAIDDCEKVRQDDLRHPLAMSPDNPVWQGQRIFLFGAKNEIIAFQLIIESNGAGARNINVRLDSLSNGSAVITNTGGTGDPLNYVGKRIELFKEHYLDINRRTVEWSGAEPFDTYLSGPVPDGLIPFEVGTTKGGAPFDIAPNKSQGVWVDVYVPAGTVSGLYTGILRVTEDGASRYGIPVQLRVYNFLVSDTTHFRNMFNIEESMILTKHGLSSNSPVHYDIEREYFKLAHRHRMDLNLRMPLDSLDAHAKGFFTGDYYTSAYRYEGPGAGTGNRTYGIGMGDQPDKGSATGFAPPTEEVWRTASDRWVTWFKQNAPETEIFRYMIDEPETTAYDAIKERAAWIHNNPGPGGELQVYCTARNLDPALFGAIDFWALEGPSGLRISDTVLSGFVTSKVNERKALGEKVAIYNGTPPAFGVPQFVDRDAAQARVNPWIAWKYGVDQYFLWDVNYYFQDARHMNPWVDQYLIIGGYVRWGDGVFLYPGQDREFPAYDKGIPGAIASIRMKNWRRGQQDYEYLWLAAQLGLGAQMESLVNSVVPHAFDECPEGQFAPPPWALRGYMYEQARVQIALAIARAVGSMPPAQPLLVSPGNGATDLGTSIAFAWRASLGAETYRLQIASDSAFLSIAVDTILSVTSAMIRPPQRGMWYYARVQGRNNLGPGSFSPTSFFSTSTTAVGPLPSNTLQSYRLYQNYPNPFNPITTISFDVRFPGYTKIMIVNPLGKEVATLVAGHLDAGSYKTQWDASNQASGVYFCSMRSGEFFTVRKLMLLR